MSGRARRVVRTVWCLLFGAFLLWCAIFSHDPALVRWAEGIGGLLILVDGGMTILPRRGSR